MTWCFEFHAYNIKAVAADVLFNDMYPSHPRPAFEKSVL